MDAKSDAKASDSPAAMEKRDADGAVEAAALPQSTADHKLRWADVWENKRVLGFSKPHP